MFMHNSREEKCIALIQRIKFDQPEYYVVPGGGVEGNETVFQAVEREIREELGVTCKALEIVEKYESATSIDFFILCKYVGGVLEPVRGLNILTQSGKQNAGNIIQFLLR